MAVKHCRAVVLWLVTLGLAASACRATRLCEQGVCDERVELNGGTAGNGGTVGHGEGGKTQAQAGEPAESGAAGQDDAGAAGAGGAAESTGPTCLEGYADCDGSEITSCETNLRWNNRHCGICDIRCEGGCAGGSCLPALHIADVQAVSMVISNTIGFVVVGAGSLMKLDIEQGVLHELAGVSSRSQLGLTSDRLYVWDDWDDEATSVLSSMPLAGTELESEPAPWIQSFGASAKGAYYVEVRNDLETVDDVGKLWFKPRADAPWELLLEGTDNMEIIASSSAGVVLSRYESDGSHLHLLDGRDIADYGLEPEGFEEAIATERGLAVLTSDSELYQLAWLNDDGTSKRYALIGNPVGVFRYMQASGSGIVMALREHGLAFAQEFDEEGLVRGRIGLPQMSSVVLSDYKFLWHTHLVDEFTPRFMRSTWFPTQL